MTSRKASGSASESGDVRAAGCVVWRPAANELEILVVHRPHYDDWSHPKGKRDPGEDDLQCALREVEEETGHTGVVGAELPEVHYVDHKGRHKVVRYWLLEQTGGSFVPNPEVDQVRWLTVADAQALLTYAHDRDLLEGITSQL